MHAAHVSPVMSIHLVQSSTSLLPYLWTSCWVHLHITSHSFKAYIARRAMFSPASHVKLSAHAGQAADVVDSRTAVSDDEDDAPELYGETIDEDSQQVTSAADRSGIVSTSGAASTFTVLPPASDAATQHVPALLACFQWCIGKLLGGPSTEACSVCIPHPPRHMQTDSAGQLSAGVPSA